MRDALLERATPRRPTRCSTAPAARSEATTRQRCLAPAGWRSPRGPRREAARGLRGLRARTTAHVVNPPARPTWRSLAARALDRLGRRDEALAHAEAELAASRHWGAPRAVGASLRRSGTLTGDIALLEEAVDGARGLDARLEHAKALAALGSALRRAAAHRRARAAARALELADACAADPLVEHARSELYATGARPRTTALGGVDALTPSERRVAALAADGQSNRDIAQALFVTPKTVEVHLSNAYRKLGIRSRRGLAGALAGPQRPGGSVKGGPRGGGAGASML